MDGPNKDQHDFRTSSSAYKGPNKDTKQRNRVKFSVLNVTILPDT